MKKELFAEYVAPEVEVISTDVEQGFGVSAGDPEIDGAERILYEGETFWF
jgi:hypothetical protein